MPNAPNLREKIEKSILTVAEGYGCGIFCDFLAHLQLVILATAPTEVFRLNVVYSA